MGTAQWKALDEQSKRQPHRLDATDMHAGGHDADHGVDIAVQRDRPSDQTWLGIEMAAPRSFADHDDAIGSGWSSAATNPRPASGAIPIVVNRSDGRACIRAFGIATAGQVHVHRPEHREVLEHAILRAPIDEVRPGYRNHIEAGCRDRAFANNDEAGDIRVWQRTQQHAVEHAEDRGGGANAERERDDDDR